MIKVDIQPFVGDRAERIQSMFNGKAMADLLDHLESLCDSSAAEAGCLRFSGKAHDADVKLQLAKDLSVTRGTLLRYVREELKVGSVKILTNA